MQMTLLVTTVRLCSGKVLISVQRFWQYSIGIEMEGMMEIRDEKEEGNWGVGGCCQVVWFLLAHLSSDMALCISIVAIAKHLQRKASCALESKKAGKKLVS